LCRSLGELKALRIWIDESGLAHRQSWFCNKVVFKDLQTGKIYEFVVNNWFGMQNGDGQVNFLSNCLEYYLQIYMFAAD
uniref:PLAT domain-containing protein n=1 Tax=Syphacia muris TaxID=451379 RepID=A0A0N5ABI4_9BILA